MSEPIIQLSDVWLSFPLLRYEPRGVKEAFLSYIKKHLKPRPERVFWAVQGVSLEVRRGEVVGLIGKNGSGKSTLLRVVSNIYAADRGTARTQGRISALLELGAGFRDELTGWENIRLSGAIMGFSPVETEALMDRIVAFADLQEFMNQPLRTYSSGMRARLGFAVASVVEPDILLIDEVLAVGDAQFRQRSMTRIEEMVKRQDTAVVIVSHNQDELRRLCSRLVLLDHGKVVMDGAPSEVLARYQELIGGKRPDAPAPAGAPPPGAPPGAS